MRRRRADERRVVITGIGAITTVGETPEELHAALVAGRSGIRRWKRPRDERHYSQIGGDLSDFDLAGHLARQGGRYPEDLMKRCLALMRAAPLPPRLVAAAALQAYHDAGVFDAIAPERIGHVLAGHNVNAGYIVQNGLTFYQEDPDYIEPLFGLLSMDTDVLAATSELLTLKGPSFTVGGACASGNVALLAGVELLRAGRADAVLITGAPIELEPVALQGWALIDAISIRSFNDTPEQASRPFDARREGFVPSEGAGAVMLETWSIAKARGARVYGELLGAATVSDASRLTRPDLDGQVRAMLMAMEDARIAPADVDYVNAHATSTPLGDAVEVSAIRAALGRRAGQIPVNSTKSMIGHCLTAAAIVELIATLQQMRHGVLHPTINQDVRDPELDLDFVPNHSRSAHIEVALSNSFGFGGINACVAVARQGT